MLRQIEWGVQNWPITKNGVLPVTTFLFRKFCFSLGCFFGECGWNKNCSRLCIHEKLIWIEVHIYSVYRVYIVYKAKSQAGNIRVKYIMTTQKGQSRKKIS